MISDLRVILEDWEYEPGKISVRKIVGRDGQEKIQTRVDLGLLQLEPEGRPDGQRPHGFTSLLDYHEHQLLEHQRRRGDDARFALMPEECRQLRHEGYLYYQRYLSLFVLEEYGAVVRDTTRNLHLMDFCGRYAKEPHDRQALEAQRPYVMMMQCRAEAYQARESGNMEAAFAIVEAGLQRVEALLEDWRDEPPTSTRSEIRLLCELRDKLLDEMPDSAEAKLQMQLETALAAEDYELAARLRDTLGGDHRRYAPPGHTGAGSPEHGGG